MKNCLLTRLKARVTGAIKVIGIALPLSLGLTAFAASVNAQEYYTGQVLLFASDYCPTGTLPANGQVLQIDSYSILHALLSNEYGGDGINTFALPDLRGHVPTGRGSTTLSFITPNTFAGAQSPSAPIPVPGAIPMSYCVVVNGTFPPRP